MSTLTKISIGLLVLVFFSCTGSFTNQYEETLAQQIQEIQKMETALDSNLFSTPSHQNFSKTLNAVDSFYAINQSSFSKEFQQSYFNTIESLSKEWIAIPEFRRTTADIVGIAGVQSCGSIDNAKDSAKRKSKFGDDDILKRRLDGLIVEIPIIFHILNDTLGNGIIDSLDLRLQEQMNVLNQAFSSTNIKFVLKDYKHVTNHLWFHKTFDDNRIRFKMMADLSIEPENTLNIFTVTDTSDLLGLATFPWESTKETPLDGLLISYKSMPNIDTSDWYDGSTLIHEIGHYLGLYHTFRMACPNDSECYDCNSCAYNGCNSANKLNGDLVGDTPAQRWCHEGDCDDCDVYKKKCTSVKFKDCDTCPNDPYEDSMANFMGYNFDKCLKQFSSGQIYRMLDNIDYHRSVFITERKPYL